MNSGFGGAVGGGHCEGYEGEARGDGHDGCVRLLLQLRKQSCCEADRAEKIRGDDGLGVGGVGFVEEVFGEHDARVVNDDVEGREVGDEFLAEVADGSRVFDVEIRRGQARIGFGGLIEDLLTTAGDDDFVAELVEGLGESAADARAAAGDEDGVAGDVHGGPVSCDRVLTRFLM